MSAKTRLLAASLGLILLLGAATGAMAKTFRYAATGDILGLDPHGNNEALTNAMKGNIYEGLVVRGWDLSLRPGLATVAIFSALACWNEFLLALLYIQSDEVKTIPTGLLAFSSRYVTDYSLLFSALSIVTIPMVVIYIVFNRQIVEGITAGSVK